MDEATLFLLHVLQSFGRRGVVSSESGLLLSGFLPVPSVVFSSTGCSVRSWTTLDFAASNSASSSLLGGHWSQMRCGGLGSETCPYDCDAFGLHTSHDA
jgi:hypothetical protein